MAFVFRLRSKIKVAHCKFSDLESILYFWPRGSLDAIYLREGSNGQWSMVNGPRYKSTAAIYILQHAD